MPWYLWVALGVVGLGAMVALGVLLDRARRKSEKGLTPEELRKKRALEDMADNLSP
jgi:hypothetical protein